MKLYYHATTEKNVSSILHNGIKPSLGGFVYLADSLENACKFGYLDACGDTIYIFTVKIRKSDESKIQETFDHNEAFFQCKSYGYDGIIEPSRIGKLYKRTFTVNANNNKKTGV